MVGRGKLFYSEDKVAQGDVPARDRHCVKYYGLDAENVSFWLPDIVEYGEGEAGVWKQTQKEVSGRC